MRYEVTLTRDYKYAKGIVWHYESKWKLVAVLVYHWYAFVQLMSAMPKTSLMFREIPTGKVIPFPKRKVRK